MVKIFNNSSGKAKLIKYPQGTHMAFNFEINGPRVDWTKDFFDWLKVRGLLDR